VKDFNVTEHGLAFISEIRSRQNATGVPEAKRNYALAITALEDAIMRTNRADAVAEDRAVW
jgi:hypothetical protein